ncbi:enoyl-CoA hydratase-related protein [Lutimaribacter marinistellae]|uniref:Enoyl-CoA hydratase-related protein n=1 Tax=Lutimaribacter marinistellae TaxID=1820329 RepID=A0ABV7TD16_9RHOB
MSKLLHHRDGNVLTLTINRPEARNAIDPELLCLMADAFEAASRDTELRAVIVTGAGDKAFCAGADLGRLLPLLARQRPPEDDFDHRVAEDPEVFNRALLRGFDIGVPVIAAVNGHAIAGGMELCQGTDLRVASENARFGVQEVKWGIFPAGGSTVRLPAQLSMARAMELLLTGDPIDAKTAFDWGFVNRVVPPAQVMPVARDLAQRIARNGPLAVRAVRHAARSLLGTPEEEALAQELRYAAPVLASEDAREGPLSFLEKRPPVFRGR